MINMDYAKKMRRCHEYVEALEEERRKIQVFQRELPLCLELVTQAIEACKKEISGGSTTTDYMQGQSECSEQTSSDGPVLEEFIPIKRSSDCSEEDDEQESRKSKDHDTNTKEKNVAAADKKKSDWLRSVQLWNNNQSPDPPLQEGAGKSGSAVEVKRNGGAFQPFHREKTVEKSVPSVGKANASATSTSTTESGSRGGGGGEANNGNTNSKKEEKEGQPQRKQRRCWSPELHRRFLHALQQLGGSHVATPKQIRELMKVDGLTNDEVKSHLQIAHEETKPNCPQQCQRTSTPICGGWRHMGTSTRICPNGCDNSIRGNSQCDSNQWNLHPGGCPIAQASPPIRSDCAKTATITI